MVVLTSHAETTTDNLLNNNSFTTDTSGWELSDNNQDKVKRDPNTYSDSASKSVRFRYQGGSISQDVDISNVPDNHIVKEIHMGYQSIGCGNTGSQWCTAGADDTVTSTITLSSTDTTEIISNVTAVPYEDGWNDYSFTEEVVATFNTNDLDVNLNIAGDDTGNSSNWYGPIVDNISFTFTIEEYIAPVIIEPIVVEPIVVEPIVVVEPEIIEPIVVIEETVIEGLSLETEVINDIILDPVAMDIPEIPQISMDIELPELPEISINIELPVNMPEIEVVEEIQEIPVNDPIEEIVEVNIEVDVEPEIEEQPEELKEPNIEQDLADAEEKTNEPNSSQKENVSKKKKDSNPKKTTTEKGEEKPQSKTVAKVNKPVVKTKEPSISVDPLGEISIASMVYLQMIPETITIQETVSLTQEMIYEQDIGAFTSSATYDSLISSASSRWLRMVDVRPKHTFSGYGR